MKYSFLQVLIFLSLCFQFNEISTINAEVLELNRRDRIPLSPKRSKRSLNLQQVQTSLLVREMAFGNKWLLSKIRSKPHQVRHKGPKRNHGKILSASIIAKGRLAAEIIQSPKKGVSNFSTANGRTVYELATSYRKITSENTELGRKVRDLTKTNLKGNLLKEP